MNPDTKSLVRTALSSVDQFSACLVQTPLLPYQTPSANAIARKINQRDGGIITIEMPRQSGKNQVSATCEAYLLLTRYLKGGSIIKTAPTFQPQLTISKNRLIGILDKCPLTRKRWKSRDGNSIQLGRSCLTFLSAQPGSNVVGATADIALIVDEGQEIDTEKFERDFSPMRAWKNAPMIVFGVRWDGCSFLERLIESNLEMEKRDSVQRHFRIEPEQVMRANPSWERHFIREKARLGEDHILFRTQYLLESVSALGDMFSPAQIASMRGDFARLNSPGNNRSYFIGIDIGGESMADEPHDDSIMVVLESEGNKSDSVLRMVNCIRWQGVNWEKLHSEILTLLELWNPKAVAIDARGIGNACAMWVKEKYRRGEVEVYQSSQSSVSDDGYFMMSLAGLNRLKIFTDFDSKLPDSLVSDSDIFKQISNARRELGSGGLMRFHVPERYGHDDILKAMSYAARAFRNSTKLYSSIILDAEI